MNPRIFLRLAVPGMRRMLALAMAATAVAAVPGVAAAAYPERRPRWLHVLFALTVPAALAVAAATWQGPMSALSAAGFILGTIGRWQATVGRMRVFFLSSTVVGAGHNALAGSAFGLASDAMTLSGHLLSLWRARPAVRRRSALALH